MTPTTRCGKWQELWSHGVASRGSPGRGGCGAEWRLQASLSRAVTPASPGLAALLATARCSHRRRRRRRGAAAGQIGAPMSPPQSLLQRPQSPSPARPTERTARVTSHGSVFIIFSLRSPSGAKSENLRWGPWAGRAKPQRLRGQWGEPSLGLSASPSPSSQGSWGPVQYRCSCKMKKKLNAMN